MNSCLKKDGSRKPTILSCLGDDSWDDASTSQNAKRRPAIYHLWRRPDCIRTDGETDCGGLGMVKPWPLAGLIIGMAFRARVAWGWWIFRFEC